jgi:hypothetical protein
MKYDRHRLGLKKILWRNPFHNLGYLKIAFLQTTFLRTQQNKVIKKKERDNWQYLEHNKTKW